MKKIGIIIVLIAVAGLILAACGSDTELEQEPEAETQPEPVSGIVADVPWSDSGSSRHTIEFTGYVIQNYEGSDIGTVALTITRLDDIYMLKQWYVFGDYVGLVTIANVRADNLKPLAGGITMPDAIYTPVVTYSYEEEGKLKIDIDTQEGNRHEVIDVPEDAYDDNELVFLLRAIPFEIGYTTNFTNVIAASAQKHVVTVTVVGEEELQVPAGSFDTYKIELTMAGDKKYLWYGKDEPHYLVKLDDGASVILLKDIGEEAKEKDLGEGSGTGEGVT